jgi:hypothetical protein
MGACVALFPVVNDKHLCLADVEGKVVVLAPHWQVTDLVLIGCLTVVGDQAYHRLVVSKLNYSVEDRCSYAIMGEQGAQEGPKHAPLRGPRVDGHCGRCDDVAYPHHLGRPIRRSRIQLQRDVFSPRVELCDELGGQYGVKYTSW